LPSSPTKKQPIGALAATARPANKIQEVLAMVVAPKVFGGAEALVLSI